MNILYFQVSEMFGGLSICSLEAVVGKDDTEHIIEVNDCAMKLMGESAEEDKQLIAQLLLDEMEVTGKKNVRTEKDFNFVVMKIYLNTLFYDSCHAE